MNGAAIGKYLDKLIMGHPRPVTDAAGVQMDEGRARSRVEADAATLQAMQLALEDVSVEESVGHYIVALATATREHPQVMVGASPRGSLALLLLSRALAAMSGRDFVVPEDVKTVAIVALAHRVTLRPEVWLRRVTSAAIVANVLEQVPVPASGAQPRHGAVPVQAGASPRHAPDQGR